MVSSLNLPEQQLTKVKDFTIASCVLAPFRKVQSNFRALASGCCMFCLPRLRLTLTRL